MFVDWEWASILFWMMAGVAIGVSVSAIVVAHGRKSAPRPRTPPRNPPLPEKLPEGYSVQRSWGRGGHENKGDFALHTPDGEEVWLGTPEDRLSYLMERARRIAWIHFRRTREAQTKEEALKGMES